MTFEIFTNIFRFRLTWGPIGANIYIPNATPPTFRSRNFLFFLNLLPTGPHKTTFRIFEILKIEILSNSSHNCSHKILLRSAGVAFDIFTSIHPPPPMVLC